MNDKFPYGYDVNAYINKAFELMKEEFPWATRDMITKNNYYGIKKVGDEYQYDRYSGGWYLEDYRFQKHKLGGYSTFVQAGNRSAGGSRTFFIPASYFKLPWDEFLDKYLQLVSSGPFYVDRDDLENTKGLKTFLGYEETTD